MIFEDLIFLWHGTNSKNHRSILRQGKFKNGTWFTPDENIARQYAYMACSGKQMPILMYVIIKKDTLFQSCEYFVSKKELVFKDSIYQ